MRERIGIVDLGSNTTRMIVMAYQPHYAFKLVSEIKETVRLIQGAGVDVLLQPEPVERAIRAVRMFGTLARATGVPRIVAVATSAVRDARNQAELLERMREETGVEFRVVTGDQEAYYGALGVLNSLPLRDGLVVDIGGGSAQISMVRGRGLLRSVSVRAGAVRLTERFLGSDPAAKSEIKALEDHVDALLRPLDWFRLGPSMQLVGLGGTIRSLANIDGKLRAYPLDQLHAYELRRDRLERICDELRRLPARERTELPGLNDERADIILAGALVLRQIMRISKADCLQVSGQGLREGVFYEQFLPGLEPPLIGNLRSFGVENLARSYDYQHLHVAKVQELALQMFDQLSALHGYGQWERELLWAAAMLHDIGVTVNYYDHHKHSSYIILNSAIGGYNHREIAIIALLARFHRKGTVDTSELRAVLGDGDSQRVAKLAALLRIAENLERSKSQVVGGVRCTINGGVRIVCDTVGDASLEIWDANRRAALFRRAYGVEVTIE